MAGPDTTTSELPVAPNRNGGIIEISLPDGPGLWKSYQIDMIKLLVDLLDKGTYDPDTVEANIFEALNIPYDNLVSGLISEDVQNAIDEIVSVIDSIIAVTGTPNLLIVDDIAELESISPANRKENLLVNVKSPYSWYQLIGGIDNINYVEVGIPLFTNIATFTRYIAISGNDLTGDGSIGNPYATLLRAITDQPKNLSNTVINYIFNESGTYVFDEDVKTALGRTQYSSCEIIFTGIVSVIESSVSFTEQVANKLLYTGSKLGVTLTEDQWVGYFISDGIRDYPISYNGAGSDSFSVEYLRGARNGLRDVVDMGVILDMSSSLDAEFLVFNFIGLPNILFTKVTLSKPGDTLEFTTLKSFLTFDFGTKIIANNINLGQFSDHTINYVNFVGCALILGTTEEGITTRNSMGNYNFTRTYIQNSNNSFEQLIVLQKNSCVELRECCIRGGSGSSFAFSIYKMASVITSKTVIFRNMSALISKNYAGGRFMSNSDQGYNNEILYNVNYIVNQTGTNDFTVDLLGIEFDGTFIDYINKVNVKRYIYQQKGIRISINGTYPEIENLTPITIIDNTSNNYIVVGSISQNDYVSIDFRSVRGILIESGTIELTNKADTKIQVISSQVSDFCGLTFAKDISGDLLRINVSDVIANGTDIILTLNLNRKII